MPPKTNRTTARVCVSSLPNETIDADEKQRRDAETPRSRLRSHYEVTSVEKAAVPARGQGNDWYRYVLSCGKARITGFHRGTREEVTEYAYGCAEDFNLRAATGKSTRTLASLAYKKQK